MSYLPEVAWSTIASNVTLGASAYRYYITVNPLDPNEAGASPMTVAINDWFIDFAGYPFLIEEVNGSVLTVYDILERGDGVVSAYAPYANKLGYVYRPINNAFLLSQSQLRKLDSSAGDVIDRIEKGVIWDYRGLEITDGYTSSSNVTKLELEGIEISNETTSGWQGGKKLTLRASLEGLNDVYGTPSDQYSPYWVAANNRFEFIRLQPYDNTLTSLASISGVQGDIIYASGTDTWTRLAKSTTANSFLKNGGTNNNPVWSTISTSEVSEGTNLYFTNARAIAALLTGYTATSGTISATDSILQAIQKLGFDKHVAVTLATDNGLSLAGQVIAMGTPSTVTSSSTNSVTTSTHTHAITAGLGFIGNGSAQYQIPVTGATPFTPTWTTATKIFGTTGLNSLTYASTAFVKMTGTNTFSLDTDTYSLSNHNHDSVYASKIHNLVDATHHPVSGLTTGHFLKATGATSYGFAAHGLTYTDVGAAPAGTVSSQWVTSGSDIYYTTGNVGIGTITPLTKFQVSTPSDTSYMTLGSANGIAFSIVKRDEQYGLYSGISGNGDTWLQVGRTDTPIAYNLLLQASGGNVGIGTTTPGYKLDVTGIGRFTSKLYLGTTTAPATDTGTLNALVWDNTTGEVKQRTITSFDYYQFSVKSSSTPTPVGSHKENEYYLTTLAVSATFAAPSGHLANGNTLLIRIKDDGTARTLAWNSIYRAVGVTLPTTTTASKTLYIGCIYNSTDSKWDVVSVVKQV